MAIGPSTPDFPLGLVTVAVPGTPVGLLDGAAFAKYKSGAGSTTTGGGFRPGQTPVMARSIILQVDPNNKGFTYFGRKGMVRATRVGVILILPPGAALSSYSTTFGNNQVNDLKVEDYYVDADNANDSLIVTPVLAASR